VAVELLCIAGLPEPRYCCRRGNRMWGRIWICQEGWHDNEYTTGCRISSKFAAPGGSVPGTWDIKLCSAL